MLNQSKDFNENYAAEIVVLKNIRKHSNADRLQCVSINGNNVITSLTAQENDLYVFFPLECAISYDFLQITNSFRDSTLNVDPLKKGFFEMNCRVRAVRLRGEKSEGYIVPVSELEFFCKKFLNKNIQISEKHVGIPFDTLFEHQFCVKYIPYRKTENPQSVTKKQKKEKSFKRLIEDQFHLHPKTAHLKKDVDQISPDDYISITNKLHGCNFVVGNVLVQRKLSIFERILKFFRARIESTEYGLVYSSRNVVKNAYDKNLSTGYYKSDIWKIVADKIFPSLPKGVSVSGEIVGYTPNGAPIQKDYDYGCQPNELDFWIFNAFYTSPCGKVFTFSHPELVAFCHKFGFKTPKTFFYGKAKDLFPELNVENHWHQNFLQKLIDTYLEKKCHICQNDVWAEGVILRKMIPFEWNAFKLKSFNFLEHETKLLDSGEIDMETQETIEETNE
jgi:hypothetical protein